MFLVESWSIQGTVVVKKLVNAKMGVILMKVDVVQNFLNAAIQFNPSYAPGIFVFKQLNNTVGKNVQIT